ncbi:MAG TPA: alpha/beta hydrolase [Nocardioides sp.]|nr:alpha/beta hydrolase [Nocardioides sp.]
MELTLADGRVLEHLTFGAPEGAPVVLFPGTPATAAGGAVVAEAAAAAGVRLIATSRPGYGRSTTSPPGLVAVARDTVELLDALGVARVGVHGISGGGPYALALAAAAPERVDRVVVSAGPGSHLDLGGLSETEAAAVRLSQAGDHDDAARLLHPEAAEQFGDAASMSLADFRARHFPAGPPPDSWFADRPGPFELFVADMHRAVQRPDGYVRDNLSWCGPWDVDLAAITCPVLLAYGRDDPTVPAAHGEWLAARLPHAELQLHPGGHGDVTFGLAAEAYEYLTR